MQEVWKAVSGFESLYEVSNHGRVRSFDRICNHKDGTVTRRSGRVLKPALRAGYPFINLAADAIHKQENVHRLVAEAFCDKPDGCNVVNHLDGDKTNNHWLNLEWTTHAGNAAHAHATGLSKPRHGDESGTSKLTSVQVQEIRTAIIGGATGSSLAAQYGVHVMTISSIRTGRGWTRGDAATISSCKAAPRNLSHRGEGHPSHILTESSVIEIIKRLVQKQQQKHIAAEFKVNPVAISNINNGLAWGYLRVPGCGEPPYFRRSAQRVDKRA